MPLTCLLALAKASPTPSWGGPLYPGGQASQRKPGLVLMQRTRGKQGWALHWGTKDHGGSEDPRVVPIWKAKSHHQRTLGWRLRSQVSHVTLP
jgi:hypothetical protein